MKVSTKARNDIIDALEERFLSGERVSVNQLITEHFDTETRYAQTLAKAAVRGWLNSLKMRLRKRHNLWLGAINGDGEYGVVKTESEYRYAGGRLYKMVKGFTRSAVQLREEAVQKRLTNGRDTEETLTLPAVREE